MQSKVKQIEAQQSTRPSKIYEKRFAWQRMFRKSVTGRKSIKPLR
jgi:hypothetical protein